MQNIIDIEKYRSRIKDLQTVRLTGKIIELTGLIIKAAMPGVRVGEVCLIEPVYGDSMIKAEVVGFQGNEVLLMPLGDVAGVSPGVPVHPTGQLLSVRVGEDLKGRVLDGLGDFMDEVQKDFDKQIEYYPVHAEPPDPLKRRRVVDPISIGIKAIDGLLTVGEGQRIGIFAAAGVGKSTLLGMIARNSEADVNVIGLIGERGREVRDFIEQDLGQEGLKRSVVVVATSDKPSLVRLKAAFVATAVAEYFRDKGKKVVLMMDSITRFARAQREIGLAIGEPPARAGYTPSVFSTLPKLLERTGNSDKGSITAFYTILVAGDDMNEPVADEVRSILDGHIILSRDLAARGHYPAINICDSVSRVMDNIVEKSHVESARKLREVLSTYEKERDLIMIGAYEEGSDPRVDYAIEKIQEVEEYLKQQVDERYHLTDAVGLMAQLFE